VLSKKASIEFQKLQRSYRDSLNIKHQNLEELWQAVDEDRESETKLRNLRLFVHRLAGSAASYGYESISNTARDFERLIIEQFPTDSKNSMKLSHDRTGLHTAMTELISAIATAIAQNDTS
jgi:HPt (histidine-containing phosphotransfer) domain-containing protein